MGFENQYYRTLQYSYSNPINQTHLGAHKTTALQNSRDIIPIGIYV